MNARTRASSRASSRASLPLTVRRHAGGRVALVTIARPRVHNSINAEVMDRLEAVLDELERDDDVRAIVLTGAGTRTFSAGGDLAWFATLTSRMEGLAMSARMTGLLDRIAEGKHVAIAALNGRAIGGGAEIATACHLRFAARTASLRFVQARRGVTTGWGGGERLMRIVGPGRALRLLATAEEIPARDALALGLVDRVVGSRTLLAEALATATSIAANAPEAVSGFLELARMHSSGESRGALRARERELFGARWEAFVRDLGGADARSGGGRPTATRRRSAPRRTPADAGR